MDIFQLMQTATAVFIGNFLFAVWAYAMWWVFRAEREGMDRDEIPLRVYAMVVAPMLVAVAPLILMR